MIGSLGLENIAMRGTQLENTDWVYGVAVYTGDVGKAPDDIRKHCKVHKALDGSELLSSQLMALLSRQDRFGIVLPEIDFIYLHCRRWVEASRSV